MISLPPVFASTTVGGASQIQLGALRPGDVVEARVEGLREGGLARLIVNGTALDVRTAAPLVPGTTVSLVVKESADGGTLLEMRRPQAAPPPDPGLPQASTGYPAVRGRELLGALISLGLARAASSPETPAWNSAPTTPAADHLPGSHPAERGDRSSQLGSAAAMDRPSVDPRAPVTAPAGQGGEATSASAARAAAQQQPATAPAGQPATVFNLVLPGTAVSTQITVVHDHEPDEPAAKRTATRPAKATTVKVSLSSDATGPVHAVLRQSDGVVFVRLWCERPDIAAAFARDRNELHDELVDADVAIGALEILAGSPMG